MHCKHQLKNGKICSMQAILNGYCILHFHKYEKRSAKQKILKRMTQNEKYINK